MNIFLTILFLFNLNIDLNQGLLTEKPVSFQPVMLNPCFSKSPLSITNEEIPSTFASKRESLNLSLLGEYNLAGGYVNMSGWQVKEYQKPYPLLFRWWFLYLFLPREFSKGW